MNDDTIPNSDSLKELYSALQRLKLSKQWLLVICFGAHGLTLVSCLLLIVTPKTDERWTLIVVALLLSLLVVFLVWSMFISRHFHHDQMVISIDINDIRD